MSAPSPVTQQIHREHLSAASLAAISHRPSHSRIVSAAIAALALLGASGAEASDNIKGFYKGKTVSVVVGAQSGTGYDVRARLLTRHLGSHIPGHPNFIVQNMQGAGFLIAANWLYNAAPRDGTTLGAVSDTLPIQPMLARTSEERANYRFDALAFNWLGSLEQDPTIGYCRKGSGVTRFEQVFEREVIVAGSTPQSNSLIVPHVISKLLDTKFRIIAGYQGTQAPRLAIERGEVDCHFTSLGTIEALTPQWLTSDKHVNFIVLVSGEPSKKFPELPTILSFAKTPEQRGAFELMIAPEQMSRPYLAPPGVPTDRVEALRAAFNETVVDEAFLADAHKAGVDVKPQTGAAVEDLLRRLYATPRSAVEALSAALPPVASR